MMGVLLAMMVVAPGSVAASSAAAATGTAFHLALNDCGIAGAGAGGEAVYNAQQGTLAVQVRGANTAQALKVVVDGVEVGTLVVGNGGAGRGDFATAASATLVEVKNADGQVLLSSNC